ncbi:MAG: exo-alpha-sialidase [Chloroflexota bacterium]|nr:exo-alpha-sialidase [Chloroflexota bacterium]
MSFFRYKRRSFATLSAFAATTVLAACGGEGTASVEEGSALEHIHGLGVDPADGQLLIATHNGLFAAPEGDTTPSQVGETTQDIMGFSVVESNRFIGSGHPALDQNLPPHLGLIESRDGGKTWENVSLLGDADFHVLESAGNQVYGFDGLQGRLMVSRNGGRDWQQRTPPAGVFALAIDPNTASRIVASTEQGLFASNDEGGKWRPLSQDLAGLLAWPTQDRLYLVDGQGQVQVSSDGGATWQTRGSIGGQPAAFIAHEDDLYAALGDGTVKRSTDGGATWAVRTTAS